MSQFMLLVRDDLNAYSKLEIGQIREIIAKMTDWSASLRKAGVHRGAEKLTDHPGKVIRGGSKLSITDGPYAESKELIGGYFLIEAKDYADAVRYAQECPALNYSSSIEVRELAGSCEVVLDRARK